MYRMRIRPIFAWYDLWVGAFIDRAKRRLYVFPIPCLGLVIEWGRRPKKYDPKNVTITFNGVPLRGFLDGTVEEPKREYKLDYEGPDPE